MIKTSDYRTINKEDDYTRSYVNTMSVKLKFSAKLKITQSTENGIIIRKIRRPFSSIKSPVDYFESETFRRPLNY